MALKQAKVIDENGVVVNYIVLDESENPADWGAEWDIGSSPNIGTEEDVLKFIGEFTKKHNQEQR
jgi:hypothetical protein